jgi:hypothetical protein
MSIECRYCEQDARSGHAKGCIAAELFKAKELLREAATGFGRVLIATSDQEAVYNWLNRCRKFLRIKGNLKP